MAAGRRASVRTLPALSDAAQHPEGVPPVSDDPARRTDPRDRSGTAARSRRGVPERLLLPPAPRDPAAAARWAEAPLDQRRAWARIDADEVGGCAATDRQVVAGLAASRLATRWRLLAAAPVFGWLVLMTVWGFGRSTYPEVADRWLLAGAALGTVAWLGAALGVALRLRRAREVLAAASADPDDGPA
jgi:hypothetical protein